MFENNPSWFNMPFSPNHANYSKQLANGPFLFQKVVNLKQRAKKRGSQWPHDSHLRYLACIYAFQDEFQQKKGRQAWSIFKKMSAFIPSRNSNQCRIHHKKMLREHINIQGILSHFSAPIQLYDSTFNHYAQQMRNLASLCKLEETTNNLRGRVQKSVIIGDPKQGNLAEKEAKNCPSIDFISGDQVKKVEDNIPTDVTYPQQPYNSSSNRRNNTNGYLQFCQPMTNQIPQAYFSCAAPQINVVGLTDQKKKQWQECHELFLAWTSKLHSLIS